MGIVTTLKNLISINTTLTIETVINKLANTLVIELKQFFIHLQTFSLQL